MSNEQFLCDRPTFPAQLNMSHPLTRGLVGCWVLNEEGGMRALDSSPYGNHGAVTGAKGHYNGRIFNGESDYIAIPNTTSLNIVGDKLTMGIWVKSDWLHSSTWAEHRLFGKNSSSYILHTYREGGQTPTAASVILYINGTGGANVSHFTHINKWMFFAGVYDGAEIKNYYNGLADGSPVAKTGNIVDSSAIALTLAALVGGDRWVKGTIGEAILYNRALSATEIKSLYLNPWEMFIR